MRVLLIENSKTVTSLMINELAKIADFPVDWADSMHKALELIEEYGADKYSLCISCLNLPDAPDGEIIETITEYQIPTIVFTAKFAENIRNKFLSMPGVVDYVVKESQATLQYLCHMVYRLIKNKEIKVLVVDDSRAMRMHMSELLRQYQFKVLEAEDGASALNVIDQNCDIKLVITDYNMTPVDGFELTKKIRETYEKDEMAVIGLSGSDNTTLSARFIKIGANDFISKPFQPEEFFCRISQTIDLIEKTKALTDAATKDFLTGLYNRRYFFEKGISKISRARREKKNIALAMLDIDHFKSVNDTFGHDIGDEVLKVVSKLLVENAREADLVARMGGKEFCILLDDIEQTEMKELFEDMREAIEKREFASLQERKYVTSSFGVVMSSGGESLDFLVKRADELLYDAKQTGRNKVTIEE